MITKPSICIVSPYLYPVLAPEAGIPFAGGAEVQKSLIAEGLLGMGYRVSAVTIDYGQPDGCQVNGIRVFKSYKPQAGLKGLRFFHPRLSGLWRALRRADADVYYVRAAGMLVGVVAKFCSLHGKRFVYAGASHFDFASGNYQIRYRRDVMLYEWGLRRADRVLVQNEQQKKDLKENFGIDGILLHNIGKNSDYRAIWDSRKVVWLGAIRPAKMPLRFVDLARKNPDIEFFLIGGPGTEPDQQALWKRVREEAVKIGNLTLMGHVHYSEIGGVLRTASVLVNTSDHEGFPNTFLEAWASGIPTVSFVGLDAGNNTPFPGIRVANIDEMASEVRRLLTDKSAWNESSKHCAMTFKKYFEFSAVADDYRRLFDGLVAEMPMQAGEQAMAASDADKRGLP